MPDLIGQGGTITLDAFYRDGQNELVDPTSPQCSIIDVNGATVVLLDNPTRHVGTGHYQYDYAVAADALLGAWAIRWYGVINGGAVEDEDGFTVVPSGSISPDGNDALATVDDLEAVLGRSLTTPEAARADRLLVAASNRVRRAAGGQKFTAVTGDVVRRRVLERHVWLPQRPVNDVSAVRLPDGTDLTFYWAGLQEIQVWLLLPTSFVEAPWPPRERDVVDITYDHGYEDIPEEIRDVVVNVVTRALGLDPLDAGLTEEIIQGYTYKRGTIGAAGPLGLLPDELAILEPYNARRKVGTLRIG